MKASTYNDNERLKKLIMENLSVNCEDIIDFIQQNFKPEDVFEESVLADWAEKNDFKKEGDA